MISRRALVVGVAGVAVAAGGGTWYALERGPRAGVRRNRFGDDEQTVPVGQLPVFAQQNADFEAVYRFAASERGQALETVPCFCGCGSVGHVSNRDCYVTSRTVTAVTYNSHGAGWRHCRDITRDVMRMLDEGRSAVEIRRAIEARYSHFGPGTRAPMPRT